MGNVKFPGEPLLLCFLRKNEEQKGYVGILNSGLSYERLLL
jgi:hypothetical protein